MMSLKHISKTYKASTIELFYIPLYQPLIQGELEGDKTQWGAKMQLAEVIHEFILNVIPSGPPVSSPQNSHGEEQTQDETCELVRKTVKNPNVDAQAIEEAQCEIINQYQQLIHPDQNKDVLTKALEQVASVFVAFDNPTKY